MHDPVLSPFALTAPSLISGGYSPIPIGVGTKYPARYEPAFSEDGRDWWPLKHWQTFCTRQAHPLIVANWATWPDAGVGLACGFGGVVAVDIDDASLIEPLLAILPPALVAKRGRKGLTAFYRAAEPLPSKNYRSASGGLLDFLSDGKQTVIPPTVHSDTGRPYEWTTARTLLDTPLADLPALTSAHVAAMEEVLAAHGWDAADRPKAHGAPVDRPHGGKVSLLAMMSPPPPRGWRALSGFRCSDYSVCGVSPVAGARWRASVSPAAARQITGAA